MTPTFDLADGRLRRTAAAAALCYVLAFLVASVIIGPPTIHAGQEGVEHSWVEGDLGPVYAGMYLLTLGFLALLPTMVYLSRALGRRTAAGALAAQTGAVGGIASIIVIVGVGFSAGAAALWGYHHDLDPDTALAINNVRNFAYFVATQLMGVYAVGTGLAAISDRLLSRWVGWGGVVVGALCLLTIPGAAVGLPLAMPVWLLWWVGVAVSLLRHRPEAAGGRAETPTTREPVGQH